MPETINGQLAMTNNGGEQSSFSTPFIEEFDSNVNRYYQYFELVVVNSDPGNVNDIEFTVHFKNKDYTELDNVFDLGTSFIFRIDSSDFVAKYTNGDVSNEDTYNDPMIESIGNSHVTIISFIMYPEKIGFRNSTFDEDCEEIIVFINGILIKSGEGFYLPFSILKNLAIGLDCNSNKVSYQWNFDNTRFLYPDLAYQCYNELVQDREIEFKYLPVSRFNGISNKRYSDINNDWLNDGVMYPFIKKSNDMTKLRFEFEIYDPNFNTLDDNNLLEEGYIFSAIIFGTFKEHEYQVNKSITTDNLSYVLESILTEGIAFIYYNHIPTNGSNRTWRVDGFYVNNGNVKEFHVFSSTYSSNKFVMTSIYLDINGPKYVSVETSNTEFPLDSRFIEDKHPVTIDLPDSLTSLDFINNIMILKNQSTTISINLGIDRYYTIFPDCETVRDIYVSQYNTYWKSLFPYTRMQFLNNHYQFSSPLLDNLLVLPYDLSNQNNNMYVEIKFYYENQSTINIPFALIGSGFKLSDSTLEDSQESQYDLSTFTGIVLRSPIGNKALLNAYIYKNGAISQTLWEDLNFSFDSESPVVAFKYLNGDDYFRIITTDTQNYVEVKVYKDITDMEVLDALKYVVIGQEINNTNGIYRPIGINFGPDNLHFEDEVQDLWDQDQYDKEFNMDIITGGSVDYEQGELSDDNGDRDIDGTLLVEALRPEDNQDIADDYIITGIIDNYISEFNILSGSMDPNRFELTIGTNDEQLSINETIHIDTELDFISTLFKNQDDTFTGTATVTIEYSSGSGFNITGTTVTVTYTGKDDNTLHFDMPFNIQAPPNDVTPGENRFGITIILDDGVNDPVSYTIGDIIVTVKAINYYKQNKAQLHQFISLSGGGV